MSTVSELKGISRTGHDVRKGIVEWTIKDVFCTVRTICTLHHFYMAVASMCLLFPQQFFKFMHIDSTSGKNVMRWWVRPRISMKFLQ